MDTIDVQFEKIINSRIETINQKAGREVARLFEEKMKTNSLQGRGFGNDQFDATYSDSHAATRRRKGLQTSRVTLRMKQRRIENTQVQTTGSGRSGVTTISHAEMGHIFKYHHDGTAMGGKTRSIWPKTPESIPETLKNRVKETVGEVLRGEK